MKITIDTEQVLNTLGHDGEHWVQGVWETPEGGMCLHGAIQKCQPKPGDACLIRQVARREGWGISFNDGAEGWSVVKNRILEGLEVTDQQLEETYGPNWRYIVALARQAASLTREQAERIGAAWKAAQDAAQDAAYNAAYNAAGGNARGVAWRAAWSAALNAAGYAAGDAAGKAAYALVVRDLICPEHYQAIAGPWESVMGPITECCEDDE